MKICIRLRFFLFPRFKVGTIDQLIFLCLFFFFFWPFFFAVVAATEAYRDSL